MFERFKEKSTSWKVGFAVSVFCAFLSLFPLMMLVYRFFSFNAFIIVALFLGVLLSSGKSILPLFFSKRFSEMEKDKKIGFAVTFICCNLAVYPFLLVLYRFVGIGATIVAAIIIAVALSLSKTLIFGLLIGDRFSAAKEKKEK